MGDTPPDASNDDFVSNPPVFRDPDCIPFQRDTRPQSNQGAVEFVTGKPGKFQGREFALKTFKLEPTDKSVLENDKRKFLAEIQHLHHARHHHVVALVYAYFLEAGDNTHAGVVMNREEPFKAYVESEARTQRRRDQIQRWFGCLANVVDYLHGIGVRHRDIKPDNILVKDGNVLLADFGISKIGLGKTLSTTTPEAARGRTAEYCPPEVEDGSSRGRSADIFALGAVFLEMLIAHSCFRQRTDLSDALSDKSATPPSYSYGKHLAGVHKWMNKLRESMQGGDWRLELLSLCQSMLHEDRDSRPAAYEVLSSISAHVVKAPCAECASAPKTDDAKLLRFCRMGSLPEVKGLVAGRPDLKDTVGAIHQASAHGHLHVVEALLHEGFKARLQDHSKQTALHCAAGYGREAVVKRLLQENGLVEIQDGERRTALHYAAGGGGVGTVTKLLSAWKGGLEVPDRYGQTALHFAAGRGHKGAALKLLEEARGGYVNLADDTGRTALHLAAGYGSEELVNVLLEKEANVNKTTTDKKWTALHFAAKGIQRKGRYEGVIKLLLEKGPDLSLWAVLVWDDTRSKHVERWKLLKEAFDRVRVTSPTADPARELADVIEPPRQYSHSDMKRISDLLKEAYPRWHQQGNRVERIYTILSIIHVPDERRAKFIDEFIEKGTTDDQLPFDKDEFQGVLSPGAQARFLETQSKFLLETPSKEDG